MERAADPEDGIGRVKGLEAERVETQVLLEFLDAVLIVGLSSIHLGVQENWEAEENPVASKDLITQGSACQSCLRS